MRDPLNVTTESDDPVLKEIGRLGVRVGFPSDRISGVDLTREERRELQRVKGDATYRAIEGLLASEAYAVLSEDQQRAAIEKTVELTRRAAGRSASAPMRARLPVTPRR